MILDNVLLFEIAFKLLLWNGEKVFFVEYIYRSKTNYPAWLKNTVYIIIKKAEAEKKNLFKFGFLSKHKFSSLNHITVERNFVKFNSMIRSLILCMSVFTVELQTCPLTWKNSHNRFLGMKIFTLGSLKCFWQKFTHIIIHWFQCIVCCGINYSSFDNYAN